MTLLSRFRRLWHTVRYLRPRQIADRIWRRMYSPRISSSVAPPIRISTTRWTNSIERNPFQLGPDQFRFLNCEGQLVGPVDWNSPRFSKLWLYNLHYFDDLNARKADKRADWHKALISRWIAENPVGHGSGWEPYTLSLRIVNWVKWALRRQNMETPWLQSLVLQVRYLRKSLEYHLLGNHLLANAKALVFAGLYFEGDEADGWLDKGLAVMRQELAEQVLDDGGHFEGSPMYHAILYEDVLDLLNLSRVYPGLVEPEAVKLWENLSQRLGQWLQVMSHPDGDIAFFNDAALGIAPEPAELKAYMGRLQLRTKPPARYHLATSGYVRLENDTAVALLDVARIGPDYQPGHAHADSLSFELSLFGRRALVNSGISHYQYDTERLRQRSTAAHNTVEINGENSSEVWHAFRVARRARPFDLNVSESQVSCSHDGYTRLIGRPVHRRTWKLSEHTFEIVDVISGSYERAIAHYHLHPDIDIAMDEEGSKGKLTVSDGQIVNLEVRGGLFTTHPTTWHPQFGLRVANQVGQLRFTDSEAVFKLSWA